MRVIIYLLVAFALGGCTLPYRPVAASSAPEYLTGAVVRQFPGATLEHVERYAPAGPYTTDYPRWRGLVMKDDKIIAEAYGAVGEVSFTRRGGR